MIVRLTPATSRVQVGWNRNAGRHTGFPVLPGISCKTYDQEGRAAATQLRFISSVGRVICGWTLRWKLIHGHLPDLGIKYDPSHARYAGQDYLKEMRDWGHRFLHVHLKGWVIIDGERFDDPPAGLDQTDWRTFMAILYGVGYEGGLSIEPHSENWTGSLGENGVKYTITYMNNILLR